jgi:transcriptional regulator with XRE-family HTH domain
MPRKSKPASAPHSICAWRLTRRYTVAHLAELTGLSIASISRIENGKQPYTQRSLEAIASVLKCDVGDLLVRYLTPEQMELRDALRDITGANARRMIRVLHALTEPEVIP